MICKFGYAKVKNLDIAIVPHHDVFRLNIPVQNAGSVRGSECAGQLNRDIQHFADSHACGGGQAAVRNCSCASFCHAFE